MAAAVPLHVHPETFNAEEAAHVAAEFVSSLDNLPGEVTFLLEEIKDKDNRINHLLQRISNRHTGLTKSALKFSTVQPSGTTFPLPIPAGAPIPLDHLSTKDQQTLIKIQGEWAKVSALQDEKIRLAERLERIVARARVRGAAEWARVGGMGLDEVERENNVKLGGMGEMGAGELVLPPGGLGSGSDGRPMKKRRPNALPLPLPSTFSSPLGTQIHPSTSMPPPSFPTPSARGSLSGRAARHARHISNSPMSEPDADADGDADGDGEVEADNQLYCLCQQKSYGEMIGCDNDNCRYEWFHVKCVNITPPLPETWYCPDCVRKLGLSSSDGKRDKKGRKR
ncbi:hypothetical protein BCR39DRAFT_542595 [Naematelia encephala]|uniref:Chromatin modification-related protein n=1 Tax=Naematelia encephala TaxID=71784 RepID=A0A1Y2ATY5_9TREE|nr:hypothetical protein BCR39DRAFT_542595 [Naematelia encephala]